MRGDVLIAAIPNQDGSPPKNRPVLIVQAEYYNQRIKNVLVAQITSNLFRQGDPAHHLIDVSTPDGKQSGLRVNSLVSCINIFVLTQADIRGKIGQLPSAAMAQIDECLKAAFGV